MKALFPLSFLSFFQAGAQVLAPVDTYLSDNRVPAVAKAYYQGTFRAEDDDRTFSIIKGLQSPDNELRPFYIVLVSKMIPESDGALSEVLFAACRTFVETTPDYLIDFLKSQKADSARYKNLVDQWSRAIAGELAINCDGTADCVNQSLTTSLRRASPANRKVLEQLYAHVRSYLN